MLSHHDTDGGWPHPDWQAFEAGLDRRLGEEALSDRWRVATAHWLDSVLREMGPGCSLQEMRPPRVQLLSPLTERHAKTLLASATEGLRFAATQFPMIQSRDDRGGHVLVMLPDMDAFFDYLKPLSLPGESTEDGNVFVAEGRPHTVLTPDEEFDVAEGPAVAGLYRSHLHHLALPLWLAKGVAQLLFTMFLDGGHLRYRTEHFVQARDQWRELGADMFWSGRAFESTDTLESAYTTAEIMAFRMWERGPARLGAALCEIGAGTAIEDAFGTHLGTTHEEFAGGLLPR